MIEIGDLIKITNSLGGISVHKVHRVTKTRAYIKYNERAEGCFRRDTTFDVQPVPRKHLRSTTQYEHIKATK